MAAAVNDDPLRRAPQHLSATPASPASVEPAATARALTKWYARHARDLPWRRSTDPYHVLVTEFMLQQTRVESGLKRWPLFLDRFPTLESLARASEEDVLTAWSGLGYYARARNLHKTARIILDRHGGRVPEDAQVLQTLPGIGPYTAGAIASIAYHRPEPALDGNQVRVLSRALGVTVGARAQAGAVERFARALLVHGPPGTLNQALMDLGQVCAPRGPRCVECPLTGCASRGLVRASARSRRPPRLEHWQADLHVRGGRIWLQRPAAEGLLAGLWLPPMRKTEARGRYDVEHKFSHRTWRLRLKPMATTPTGKGKWVRERDLELLPHSSLTRILLRRALQTKLRPSARAGLAPI